MRFEGSLRNGNECSIWPALFALAVAGFLSTPGLAVSAEPTSFVYCVVQAGKQIFAGRRTTDGDLAFGISLWFPNGHNISVFGTARRHGRGWRYTENIGAATAAERCRLDIVRGGDGSLTVAAAPDATCQSQGGHGTEISTVRFPPVSYDGPVKTELDDPEAFQKVRKCGLAQK